MKPYKTHTRKPRRTRPPERDRETALARQMRRIARTVVGTVVGTLRGAGVIPAANDPEI